MRILGCVGTVVMVVGAWAPGAGAEPLLVSVQGFLPTLTVTQQSTMVQVDGTRTPLPPVVQTFANVAFSATFTFDSDRWALATPNPVVVPGFQQLLDADPANPPIAGDTGISTDEWLRGAMTLDLPTPQSLTFDRDFVTNRPAGAQTVVPFNGFQEIGFHDDDAVVPADNFQLATNGGFGYTLGGPASDPSLPVTQFESWFFDLFLLQEVTAGDLFGPGAPTAFTWDDPTPITCATLVDCLPQGTVTGRFSFETDNLFLLGPGLGRSDQTLYSGDLLFTQVTMTAAAAPVPEPATLMLTTAGLVALLSRRWRPARTS